MAQQLKKMVIEDLELEFESEEKKGDGSIQPDVELVFAVEADKPTSSDAPTLGAGNVTPIGQAKKTPSPATQSPPQSGNSAGQMSSPNTPANGEIAHVSQEIKNQTMQAAQAAIDASLKQLQTTLQLQMQQMSQTLLLMQQKLQQVESKIAQGGGGTQANANPQVDYERKLAVSDYRGDISGDFKLLEFKINQILLQVHAKNPNFQKEILNIKKMMQDFQVKFQKKE